MKKKRLSKRSWLIIVCIVAGTLGFLLYPLGSPKFAIVFDEQKIEFKKSYLASLETEIARLNLHRPNIILLVADDLGKTDISIYGNKIIQTPHIDAIGNNGVVCTEGYITSPICSPSRAGLMTGRYQQRFGYEFQPHARYPNNRLEYYVYKWFIATDDWRVSDRLPVPRGEDMLRQGMPPTEIMLPELLKKYNYRTAIMGKWHLGANQHSLPLARGFDYHYGFYEAYTLYYADTSSPNIENQRHTDFSDKHIWGKARTGNCAIYKNHQIVQDTTYLTSRLAAESVQWLEENHKEPFFLYVPFLAPHTPFQATKEYYDKYAHITDRNKRIYYAMIHCLDDAVGQITQKVKDLGIEENTLIVFISDNGGATYTHATDNAPLKGGKFSNFEGGINVPFLAQWKGTIPAGTRYEQPVISMDIFATITSILQTPLPKDRPYDGVNLLPYWLGENKNPPHDALYWRSDYHKAIRQGAWKLIKDEKANLLTLYNLQTDKNEKTNVASQYPDQVLQLEELLEQWEKQLRSPMWPNVMDYSIHDGERTYYFPL